MDPNHGPDLSDGERALLVTAVRDGYFEAPRHIPLAELADKHDMTDLEASIMMRRGLDKVVRYAVLAEH